MPLFLQIDNLLILWLKNPPESTGLLCRFILLSILIEKMAVGNESALNACGNIKHFQIALGSTFIAGIFITYGLLAIFGTPAMIGWSMVISQSAGTIIRLYYGKRVAGIGILDWVKEALNPNLLTIAIVGAGTALIIPSLPAGMWSQLIITTCITTAGFVFFGWIFIFDKSLKQFVKAKIGIERPQ